MPARHRIYCLEHVPDVESTTTSVVYTGLENLALQYGMTNVYTTCDGVEGFEESISTLLYEDRHFKDYTVLYLVFEGRGNEIKIGNYFFSFEEVAEFFEGKLTGKIVHFANPMLLDLDEETFQYFIDVTGAKALSGYTQKVPVLSTPLDHFYFSLLEEHDDVVDLVEALYAKHATISQTLGFRLYY
jgi:hypothetical protein